MLVLQIDTINARHSPKYFGLHKGVSSYTLVANHVPINAKIIGTHEHESHFVFDLLYNNSTEIKPWWHSTDTHGTNHINFWTLYVFGYFFAPRYRNLRKKTASLIGFRHPSHYSADFLIRPSRKANDELIIKEWPNVQRIMASLACKDVTQATIVRKLCSYPAFTIRLFKYLGTYLQDTRDSTEGRSNETTEILPQRGDLVTTVCNTLEYDQDDIMNFIEAFIEKVADQRFALELYQHFSKTINILPNFPS